MGIDISEMINEPVPWGSTCQYPYSDKAVSVGLALILPRQWPVLQLTS